MSISKEQSYVVAGAAIAVIGYGIWAYVSAAEADQPQDKIGKHVSVIEEAHKFFEDTDKEAKQTLYKTEAFKRSDMVSDVSYKLAYALNRGGETFQGHVEMKFTLSHDSCKSDDIFVDYRGDKVHILNINGKILSGGNPFHGHRIHFPKEYLKQGVNQVEIRFTSAYVRDCAGIQYFKDKDDGEEYLYSDFEPHSCHNSFPCFDQPDLKATYEFLAVVPKGWSVFSNS